MNFVEEFERRQIQRFEKHCASEDLKQLKAMVTCKRLGIVEETLKAWAYHINYHNVTYIEAKQNYLASSYSNN